jgi:hypothetical protein
MHTSTLAVSHVFSPRRLAILIGAGLLASASLTAGRAYIEIQDSASDRLVQLDASFKAAPDLATLRDNSDLVVVGRIAREGTTRMVAQTGNNASIGGPAPAPFSVDPKKAEAEKAQPPAPGPSSTTQVGNANLGTPVTTYTVQVERSVKGNAPAQISLAQLGGKVTLDTYPGGPKLQRSVEFEGDTLMKPGERNVLFLNRASDGTFVVGSGPQGRLGIDQTGKVHPIDPNAPALKAHEGADLEGFIGAVNAARKRGLGN